MDAQSGFQIGTFSLGTLAGILVGAILGHFLTNVRWKREYLQRAKDQFREELLSDLVELQDMEKEPYEVISAAIKRHLLAKARFERYLKGNNLQGLNSAWDEYYLIDVGGGRKIPFIDQYFPAGSIDQKREMRATAIRRVEKLISYAEALR